MTLFLWFVLVINVLNILSVEVRLQSPYYPRRVVVTKGEVAISGIGSMIILVWVVYLLLKGGA